MGYYVGLTSNVEKRLLCHNNGYVRSTKNRRPFVLIYTETFNTRAEARDKEKYFKSYAGAREKLRIIDNL